MLGEPPRPAVSPRLRLCFRSRPITIHLSVIVCCALPAHSSPLRHERCASTHDCWVSVLSASDARPPHECWLKSKAALSHAKANPGVISLWPDGHPPVPIPAPTPRPPQHPQHPQPHPWSRPRAWTYVDVAEHGFLVKRKKRGLVALWYGRGRRGRRGRRWARGRGGDRDRGVVVDVVDVVVGVGFVCVCVCVSSPLGSDMTTTTPCIAGRSV